MYGRFFMYFSIIPFSHSIGTSPLIYLGEGIIENNIQVGSLVEIPYGNSIENGIITKIYIDSPINIASEAHTRIKTITRIVTPRIILAQYQIDMVCAISARYMIPIHRVLAIFLPRPILTRLERKNYEQLENSLTTIHPDQQRKLHIVQDTIVIPELVDTYMKWPTIVILPDDFAMIPYREYYPDRDDILFMSNDMTDVRKAQAWIDISNGVFPIIYWTRKILDYNLSKYSNILYIEDSLGPDYWHYPIRIHYNDILRIFIQENPLISFSIITSIPTLATLTHFRNFEIKNIQ